MSTENKKRKLEVGQEEEVHASPREPGILGPAFVPEGTSRSVSRSVMTLTSQFLNYPKLLTLGRVTKAAQSDLQLWQARIATLEVLDSRQYLNLFTDAGGSNRGIIVTQLLQEPHPPPSPPLLRVINLSSRDDVPSPNVMAWLLRAPNLQVLRITNYSPDQEEEPPKIQLALQNVQWMAHQKLREVVLAPLPHVDTYGARAMHNAIIVMFQALSSDVLSTVQTLRLSNESFPLGQRVVAIDILSKLEAIEVLRLSVTWTSDWIVSEVLTRRWAKRLRVLDLSCPNWPVRVEDGGTQEAVDTKTLDAIFGACPALESLRLQRSTFEPVSGTRYPSVEICISMEQKSCVVRNMPTIIDMAHFVAALGSCKNAPTVSILDVEYPVDIVGIESGWLYSLLLALHGRLPQTRHILANLTAIIYRTPFGTFVGRPLRGSSDNAVWNDNVLWVKDLRRWLQTVCPRLEKIILNTFGSNYRPWSSMSLELHRSSRQFSVSTEALTDEVVQQLVGDDIPFILPDWSLRNFDVTDSVLAARLLRVKASLSLDNFRVVNRQQNMEPDRKEMLDLFGWAKACSRLEMKRLSLVLIPNKEQDALLQECIKNLAHCDELILQEIDVMSFTDHTIAGFQGKRAIWLETDRPVASRPDLTDRGLVELLSRNPNLQQLALVCPARSTRTTNHWPTLLSGPSSATQTLVVLHLSIDQCGPTDDELDILLVRTCPNLGCLELFPTGEGQEIGGVIGYGACSQDEQYAVLQRYPRHWIVLHDMALLKKAQVSHLLFTGLPWNATKHETKMDWKAILEGNGLRPTWREHGLRLASILFQVPIKKQHVTQYIDISKRWRIIWNEASRTYTLIDLDANTGEECPMMGRERKVVDVLTETGYMKVDPQAPEWKFVHIDMTTYCHRYMFSKFLTKLPADFPVDWLLFTWYATIRIATDVPRREVTMWMTESGRTADKLVEFGRYVYQCLEQHRHILDISAQSSSARKEEPEMQVVMESKRVQHVDVVVPLRDPVQRLLDLEKELAEFQAGSSAQLQLLNAIKEKNLIYRGPNLTYYPPRISKSEFRVVLSSADANRKTVVQIRRFLDRLDPYARVTFLFSRV